MTVFAEQRKGGAFPEMIWLGESQLSSLTDGIARGPAERWLDAPLGADGSCRPEPCEGTPEHPDTRAQEDAREVVTKPLMLRILCLLLAILGTSLMAADLLAEKRAPGFASPQEAWEVYRHARHQGQWRKAFQCLTPESQARFVAVIVMSWGHMDAHEDHKRAADRLKAVLKKHGLDPDQVEAESKGLSLEDYVKRLNRRVKDKEGLFHEAMTIVAPLVPQPKGKDGKRVIPYGPLTKVHIAADRATGECMKRLDDSTISEVGGVRQTEIEQEVQFRNINGRWFCVLMSGY